MTDMCFAIKDIKSDEYYCGLKKWDKQLRFAKLYHSLKHVENYMIALDVRNFNRELVIVKVIIAEVENG